MERARRGLGGQIQNGTRNESEDGFGACPGGREVHNYLIINGLMIDGNAQAIGGVRAIGGGVGAFQMTRCRERQARGKGLACHFLQIVPTCL